ncbi:MAG: hypothetical protein NT072_10535 [Deltaproteobacteria bacterium]|nr:hypothetical protein [Deltaproteobacteria bacterium]
MPNSRGSMINPIEMMKKMTTPAQRKAAAKRFAAARKAAGAKTTTAPTSGMTTRGALVSAPAVPTPGGTPDYFGIYPNYANSPLPQLDGTGNVIPGTGIKKFVDSLPGLGPNNANNLGQYIPVANPDTLAYPGSDYYEIAVQEYSEQMHTDLTPTRLRGYVQLNNGTDTSGANTLAPAPIHYLGPMIIAQKDRPVRIKLVNQLPLTANGGDLFLPVDTTVMGAGTGPNGGTETYTQNRAAIHLHGGFTPWISDGTPHQWITPDGENTSYPVGLSLQDVPDMPIPPNGSATLYYPNQQSARLMFYHDHAYGITRLNVYAGEAAGYLLTDPVEQGLINSGIIPADQIPLIIQDKTFVPDTAQLAAEDPTWDTVNWGAPGDLWLPHVYMPNQNIYDLTGTNAMGRWDYGPWFWPPYTGLTNGPIPNPYYDPTNAPWEPPDIPGTPNPSIVPEAFMDTPVVNGTAYPVLTVAPKPYRLRVLNACNDRFLNLQLYYVDPLHPTEVKMVPAFPNSGLPPTWPTDARDGGVPDPTTAGPDMIQIGTEGGFLPAPAVIPATPVGYNYNRRDIVVLNVLNHALFLGPAERADIIVDFSGVPDGSTLILYNDAPAPVPAFDPRNDYYTGNPDQTDMGGAPSTLEGYGPNTRTIMQIQVAGTASTPFNLTALRTAFASSVDTLGNPVPGAFAASQDPIIVPQARYNSAYNKVFPNDAFARIQSTSLNFTTLDGTLMSLSMKPKAIQELFEPNYGRMNAILGVELPNTSATIQTTIPYFYIDPPTETIDDSLYIGAPVAGDGTQIWKITHNGVDTHAIHFHLFNVQLINRVGWDGAVRPPDANELGWKETIRMNPLEDAIVAMRATDPLLPFGIPDSVRPLNVTAPIGSTMGFTNIDPNGNPITVTNELTNFGWEYVWHCHLLGHEENDMMRPMVFHVPSVAPAAPFLSGAIVGSQANLTWSDATPAGGLLGSSANEIGFRVQRATVNTNGIPGTYSLIGSALANATSYIDTTITLGVVYSYRVVAYNAAGSTNSNAVTVGGPPPAAPTGLTATLQTGLRVLLSWTDNATNETGFVVERAVNTGAFVQIAAPGPRTGTGTVNYTDTTVTPGNTYDYRVKAVNIAGSSAYSNTALAIVPSLPAAPTGLTATLQTGLRVLLAWTDNATNETGFVVERALNGGAFAQIALPGAGAGTGALNYTDTTVTPGNTYDYRVKAVNIAGSSAYSNTASAIVPSLPAAPTGLTATLQTGPQVLLSWTDNATNETGFVVERAVNTGAFVQIAAPGPRTGTGTVNYTDTTVTATNTYSYRVKAVNIAGSSAYSNTASTAAPTRPAAPSRLTATVSIINASNDQVVLRWSDNSNNETGFTIQRSTNSLFTANVNNSTVAANTTTTSQTVARRLTLYYRVQSFNAAGTSAWSNIVRVITP